MQRYSGNMNTGPETMWVIICDRTSGKERPLNMHRGNNVCIELWKMSRISPMKMGEVLPSDTEPLRLPSPAAFRGGAVVGWWSGEVNLLIRLGRRKDIKEIPKLRDSKKHVMLAYFFCLCVCVFFPLDTLTCYDLLISAQLKGCCAQECFYACTKLQPSKIASHCVRCQ